MFDRFKSLSSSTSNPVKKVLIVCVGERHDDPSATHAILSAIKAFRAENIPVVYSIEAPCDSPSLVEELDILNRTLPILEESSKKPPLNDFFYNEEGIPYLWFDYKNKAKLETAVKQMCLDKGFDEHYWTLTNDFIYSRTMRAKAELFSYLLEHEIDYVPTDINSLRLETLINQVGISKSDEEIIEILNQYENDRITSMVDNGRASIEKQKETGGIIIHHNGARHSERLAAHFRVKCQVDSIALICTSESGPGISVNRIEESKSVDSEEIKNSYKKSKCGYFKFKMNKHGYSECKEFDDVILSAISYVKSTNNSSFLLKSMLIYGGAVALFGLFNVKLALNAKKEISRVFQGEYKKDSGNSSCCIM